MNAQRSAGGFWRLVAAAFVALVPLAADWADLLGSAQDRLTASRMAAKPRPPSGEIVLVDIDAKSLAALGTWPWPRRLHAQLIDRLRAAEAAEIAFDIDFSAASNPEDDAALEAALTRAEGTVILATFLQDLTGDRAAGVFQNRPLARFAEHAWLASVTVKPDPDGGVRRNNYGVVVDGEPIPSLAALLGGGHGVAGYSFTVDFSIDAKAFDRIPVIDVLEGTVDVARLRGKKVIVGAQAIELRDRFQSPIGGQVSGSLLQALAAETLKQSRAILPSSPLLTAGGLLVIGAGAFAIGRIRWQLLIAAFAAGAIVLEAAAVQVQAALALAINTAPLLLAVVLLTLVTVASELNLRRLLQNLWRRRAADAESILARIVDDNFAGILVVDGDGAIQAASRAAGTILGCADLPGRRVADVLPVDLAAVLAAGFARPGPAGEPQRMAGESTFPAAGEAQRTLEYVVTFSEMAREAEERPNGSAGRRVACLTFNDVTQQRADAARIAYMARYDAVTHLPNRNQLMERLDRAMADAAAGGPPPAVVCFDLDGFKTINDTYGHAVGDLLLAAVAERASLLLPPGGLAARLGGDEFTAIVTGAEAEQVAAEYAASLTAEIAHPFEIGGRQIHVGASAGVASAEEGEESSELLMRGDVALYRAKSEGGNVFRVFEPEMLSAAASRQRMELDLREAMEAGRFEVWYQPQVDLRSGRVVGAEALLRWRHPKRGFVPPAEFIPVAEAIGLIVPLGSWVLETACTEATSWPEGIKLSVNFSSAQFTRSNSFDVVAGALQRSGLEASRLELEITESVLMKPSRALTESIRQLRALGVTLALDDFGTGYSSLSYIQKFPVAKIKIDRSFVANLPRDPDSCAIVRAVARLAGDLGIRLNAEGIEASAQAEALLGLGVDEGQGFLYGKAQPGEQFRRRAHAETSPPQRASA
ncbi:MAG: EAL domain-containing protein [Bauldia sp.]